MSARRDYYYRQLVTEAELDDGFGGLEDADRALMVDMGVFGVNVGGGVAQNGSPNLTVNVTGPMAGYDQLGQRISIASTQNKDVSVDDSNASTTVVGVGNERWLSLFVQFDRLLSDPRTDGNSNSVYFVRDESYKFKLVAGAEAAVGLAVRPSLITDGILLADINRTQGQTQILNADISTTRRQDYIKIAGSPNSIQRGRVTDALSDILGIVNTIAGAVSNLASGITYGGGASWADGTTNPSASVEVTFDNLFTKLASTSGSGGAAAIGIGARTTWLGGRTNAAGTLFAAVDKIITDLALTTSSDDGAERIGAQSGNGYSAGSVRSQLNEVAPGATGTAYSAQKTFNGAAGDTNGALATTVTPTNRKLLWQISAGTIQIRFYARSNSGGGEALEVTANAVWGGSTWSADDTSAAAQMLAIGTHTGTGARDASLLRKTTTTGTWSSWDTEQLRFLAGDPGASSTGYHNTLTTRNMCKLWASISVSGGTATVDDGFNVTSAAVSGTALQVTIGDNMADTDYAVIATNRSSLGRVWEALNITTTSFQLRCRLVSDGSIVDLSSTAGDVSVMLLGKSA